MQFRFFPLVVRIACCLALLVLVSCARSVSDYLKKGNQLYADGQYAEAALNYRAAIQKEPGLGEAHYRLGLTLLKQGDKTKAHQSFKQAAEVTPDLTDAGIQLADLLLEAYMADMRRPRKLSDELRKIAAELLTKDARSFDGLRIQGYLEYLDNRPTDALDSLRKANEIRPLEPFVVRGLMQVLAQTRQIAEAEKLGLALIAKDSTYGLIYDDLYALYRATGRHVEAERIFVAKVSNNPAVIAYRLQLAAHYINHNKQAIWRPR